MKKKIKSIKVKLYHKLINNKLIYDNKPLNRYKNSVNIIPNIFINEGSYIAGGAVVIKNTIKNVKRMLG